jgi:hypothetical protein
MHALGEPGGRHVLVPSLPQLWLHQGRVWERKEHESLRDGVLELEGEGLQLPNPSLEGRASCLLVQNSMDKGATTLYRRGCAPALVRRPKRTAPRKRK